MRQPRTVRTTIGVVTFVVVMLTAGPAAAGSWAVTTLDSVPAAASGETVEIGFTIRQHGVTPVNPDGSPDRDVGIVLRSEGGEEWFFAAEPSVEVGHYIAEVTYPDDGTWSWAVRQGWFGEQELGVLELVPRSIEPAVGGYRWPIVVRLGLPVLALLLAAGAAVDLYRGRRRTRGIVTA